MNQNPLISIITPLFNAEKYISATIDSVLAQSYPYWEMIIVDDGSTDNSYNIVNARLKEEKCISLYQRDRLPKGVSTSRNIGIEKAKGDYILFLDADDIIVSTCLENRLKAMQKENDPHFCVFQMDMLSDDPEFSGRLLTTPSDNYLFDFISYKLPWTVTSPMWKASFLKERLVGFNENFIRLEDPELHIRALLEEGVRYKVFSESEYLDCSYRFFRGKINLSAALVSFKQYLEVIYDKIIVREEKNIYLKALQELYDQIILFYSTYPDAELRKNASLLKEINKAFLSRNIIDKKLYKKTNFFLFYITNKLNKSSPINKILLRAGFDHFYAFRIPTSKSEVI